MAINFFKWLVEKTAKTTIVDCADLFCAAQDYLVRDLCFHACVDMKTGRPTRPPRFVRDLLEPEG